MSRWLSELVSNLSLEARGVDGCTRLRRDEDDEPIGIVSTTERDARRHFGMRTRARILRRSRPRCRKADIEAGFSPAEAAASDGQWRERTRIGAGRPHDHIRPVERPVPIRNRQKMTVARPRKVKPREEPRAHGFALLLAPRAIEVILSFRLGRLGCTDNAVLEDRAPDRSSPDESDDGLVAGDGADPHFNRVRGRSNPLRCFGGSVLPAATEAEREDPEDGA